MKMSTTYNKPLPNITEDNKEFWDWCKKHELRAQKCGDCGTLRYPPQPFCRECLSNKYEYVKLSGKGKVNTHVRYHQRYNWGWDEELPYIVIEVEADEAGLKFVGNFLKGTAPPYENLKIGMPVKVAFDDVTAEVTLPKWVPA